MSLRQKNKRDQYNWRHVPKSKLRWLKNPGLRKIRAEFRNLLYAWFKKEQRRLLDEQKRIYGLEKQGKISRESGLRRRHYYLHKRQALESAKDRYPISCGWCSNKEEDLVFEEDSGCYLCVDCHKGAYKHKYKIISLDE